MLVIVSDYQPVQTPPIPLQHIPTVLLGLRDCLMLFSLMRNGSTLLENQRDITCFQMRMSPCIHAEVRTTSLRSCFCVLLLGQGLTVREFAYLMERLGVFHWLHMNMLREVVLIVELEQWK